MKTQITILTLCTILLSACSGTSNNGVSVGIGLGGMLGSRVGVGTSINIPIGSNTTTPSPNTQIPEQQIITHFDTQGHSSENSVKGGYYRQLLAKQNNDYLVQDFYSSGEKRTDPMLLSREQLFTFRAHPNNGSYTVYAINGNIMQQQNFRNGVLVK